MKVCPSENCIAMIFDDQTHCVYCERAILREVLRFYAEPSNWRSPSEGFALQYDPEPSPVHADRGEKAREALE